VNNLNRDILKLSLPSILANITVPLVGMVDIAVAGHLNPGGGSAACIGGISIGSMLFDLLYWNFGFLRVGTGGLTAQATGRKDERDCSKILSRGLLLSLAISFLLILIQKPFTQLAFLVVKCSDEVKALALQYFFIRIWAAPATLSLMAFKGWFIGMQDSVSSMFTDLVVNVINVGASVILALGFGEWEGLGYAGVAYGTLIAQYSGLLFAGAVVALKYRRYSFIFDTEGMRDFFSMNLDLFIRSLGFIAIYIGYTTLAAGYGDLMLASSAIIMKLLMLFSYFTDGFAYAAEALCGKYIGAGDRDMTSRTVRYTFIWSMAIALAFTFIYIFCGNGLIEIMTSDSEVALACSQFILWLALMPLLGCSAFTWDGIFLGATASRQLRNSMILATAAFFILWFALGPLASQSPEKAIHCLLVAYFAHLLVRTVYLSASYGRMIMTRCP